MRPPVLALLGPTASGKTAVAIELCRLLSGEIIAADSRQVYRGFRIGSAAPTDAELAAAPHHLVGFLDPRRRYSVAEFVASAEHAIAQVSARGLTPIVVAGTGMYLKALVTGWTLADTPPDPEIRAGLMAELEAVGSESLHARLAALDPAAAARISPRDAKRIVRALEVCQVTGRPLSEVHAQRGRRAVPFDYRLFALVRPREELYARIDARVHAQLTAGWLDEVRALLAAGLDGHEPAMESLGYRRLVAHLRGEISLEEAICLIQRDTRRFAKRQMTWWRSFDEVDWIHVEADEAPSAIAARIAERWTAWYAVRRTADAPD